MAKYITIPLEIEAFKFGIDIRPDWFTESELNEKIKVFYVGRYYPQECYCEIYNGEDISKCSVGDYIIRDKQGKLHTCSLDLFEQLFKKEI